MAGSALPASQETRRDSGWLERECAGLAARLRSRCSLLELEVYELVRRRVPELGLGGDVELQARARATISAIVEHCLDTIEQGPVGGSLPEAVLERARAAAREGASVGPLLRGIEAGYQPFVAFVIADVRRLPHALLVREHLRETYGGLLGDISAAVEGEYERERAARSAATGCSGGAARSLTRREREVLELLLEGRSYKQIAQALHVTPDTVHSHASHVYRKLDVKGRSGLTRRT